MTRVISPLLLGLAVVFGGSCRTAKSPFPESYSNTRLDAIAKLRAGDTAAEVIGKLGSPASVEVIVPWLMYYAADKDGFYYRVSFELTKSGELQLTDRLKRVTITKGLFDGADPQVVWPETERNKLKNGANQAPEPTTLSVTPAADAPVAPRSVAARL